MASILEVAPRPSLRLAAVAGTLLAVAVVLADLPTPVRAPIVLLWVFVVPGWTWARTVGIGDRTDVLVLSIAVSAVFIVLIAGAMAITGAWSPGWAFTLLVVVSLAGLPVPGRRRPSVAEEVPS